MPTSICAYSGAAFASKPRALNSSASRCSTWLATSLMRLANVPVDWADRGVPDQDPEPVGRLLDVVEQRQRGLLEQHARAVVRAERRR